jgi:coiled-coil and C2 domain-containing protein 2A
MLELTPRLVGSCPRQRAAASHRAGPAETQTQTQRRPPSAPAPSEPAEARSVVITQPNNRLSRVLKALLRELPAQLAAIDAAALEASCALAEGGGLPEGAGGGEAADYAAAKLRERTRLLRSLQASRGSAVTGGAPAPKAGSNKGARSGRGRAAGTQPPESCSARVPSVETEPQAAHNARVSREMRGCVINGQVLALPFSDNWAAAAAEAVLNTGLHRTTDPRVKFAMAAFVEPMGAAWVCRMWVYAAAVRDAT